MTGPLPLTPGLREALDVLRLNAAAMVETLAAEPEDLPGFVDQLAALNSRFYRMTSALICLLQPASTPVEGPVQAAASDLPAIRQPPDPWRAAHRPGQPSKLDTDAELAAFVRARLDRLTFPQIAAEVAAAFPPGRRTSSSAIHRWWHRTKPRRPAQ